MKVRRGASKKRDVEPNITRMARVTVKARAMSQL